MCLILEDLNKKSIACIHSKLICNTLKLIWSCINEKIDNFINTFLATLK